MCSMPGAAAPKIGLLGPVNLLANTADQIATVALPVVFVSQMGGDARGNSVLTFAATLPLLLFSLPLGALADRWPLRRVLFLGEVVRLAALVLLLLVLQLPSPPIVALALLAMIGGTGTVAFQVSAPAMVARASEGEQRRRLNGSIEMARSIAITAGPPLAGVLVGFAGGSLAFGLAIAFVIAALLAIMRLPTFSDAPAGGPSLLLQLREGLRFTLSHPLLRPILLISMIFNLGWYVLLGVIVAWASDGLGMSSFQIGLMFAGYGVGMVTGATALRRFGNRLDTAHWVRTGPICGFAFACLIAITIVIPSPLIVLVAFFLVGLGPIIWTITTVGIRQDVTPSHLIGRVSATNMTISAGARPIGALVGLATYAVGGFTLTFVIATLLFGLQAFWIGQSALVRSNATSTESMELA